MANVRVLQFITPAGFYGAERWVVALANNANHSGVTHDLAVTKESPDHDLSVAAAYPADAGEVHYLDMRGRFDWQVVKKLVNVIRARNIDVIHTHGYKSDILGLFAARLAGIKCVSTPHGFSGNVGFKLAAFIRLGTFMLRFFDRVVPLSEELMDDMKRFNVPVEKTVFIRNGVDLKEIDETIAVLKARATDGGGARSLGFIGQMIPRKGVPHLLQAFDLLYAKNSDLKLQLIGDGRQRNELELQAKALASDKAIEFLGFRSDRLELLSRFTLFVMTSSLEGIPRCMMEAMAIGVPVVAFDIPGVDQLVEHEVTGLLAPLGDVPALAACCQRLLDDPGFAKRLAGNARTKIDQMYSARRMADEYENLFRQLLGREH